MKKDALIAVVKYEINKYYKVPVVIEYENNFSENYDEEDFWLENKLDNFNKNLPLIFFTPVYLNYHSDKKSGQNYFHYHKDYRWEIPNYYNGCKIIGSVPRPTKKEIVYVNLKFISENHIDVTPSKFLEKYNLKLKMKNYKCVHKKYDLRNEIQDKNGCITCPLHGLKYKNNLLIK